MSRLKAGDQVFVPATVGGALGNQCDCLSCDGKVRVDFGDINDDGYFIWAKEKDLVRRSWNDIQLRGFTIVVKRDEVFRGL